MTRSLAEVEAELALVKKRDEAYSRVWRGGLSPEEDRLTQEAIQAVNAELEGRAAKRTPPVEPDLPKGIADMPPRDAAARAAKLLEDPAYFGWVPPEKRAAADALHAEAQALRRRAMDLPIDVGNLAPEAAAAKAETLRRSLSTEFFPTPDARAEVEREIAWLNARAAKEAG